MRNEGPNNEKLNSIRRRIKNLREALEDPTLLTTVAVDGVSETVDRAGLRAELKELEEEEARLTGATRRVYSIGFRR